MRMVLVVVLWVVATVAATGLAFGAVAIVGEAATAPPAVLAPIDAPGDGPVEIVAEEGALAVECEADAVALVWAQPAEGSTVSIREVGPAAVVVEFAEDDEVTRVEVVCVDGKPTWTILERDVDEPADTTSTTSTSTTSTTEADDDDDRPATSTTSPSTTSTSTTSTTEPDDDVSTTSTTEADDDVSTTSTTEADDDVTTTSTTEADDDVTTTSTTDPDDDD